MGTEHDVHIVNIEGGVAVSTEKTRKVWKRIKKSMEKDRKGPKKDRKSYEAIWKTNQTGPKDHSDKAHKGCEKYQKLAKKDQQHYGKLL